jgi:hypothetical protein
MVISHQFQEFSITHPEISTTLFHIFFNSIYSSREEDEDHVQLTSFTITDQFIVIHEVCVFKFELKSSILLIQENFIFEDQISNLVSQEFNSILI